MEPFGCENVTLTLNSHNTQSFLPLLRLYNPCLLSLLVHSLQHLLQPASRKAASLMWHDWHPPTLRPWTPPDKTEHEETPVGGTRVVSIQDTCRGTCLHRREWDIKWHGKAHTITESFFTLWWQSHPFTKARLPFPKGTQNSVYNSTQVL